MTDNILEFPQRSGIGETRTVSDAEIRRIRGRQHEVEQFARTTKKLREDQAVRIAENLGRMMRARGLQLIDLTREGSFDTVEKHRKRYVRFGAGEDGEIAKSVRKFIDLARRVGELTTSLEDKNEREARAIAEAFEGVQLQRSVKKLSGDEEGLHALDSLLNEELYSHPLRGDLVWYFDQLFAHGLCRSAGGFRSAEATASLRRDALIDGEHLEERDHSAALYLPKRLLGQLLRPVSCYEWLARRDEVAEQFGFAAHLSKWPLKAPRQLLDAMRAKQQRPWHFAHEAVSVWLAIFPDVLKGSLKLALIAAPGISSLGALSPFDPWEGIEWTSEPDGRLLQHSIGARTATQEATSAPVQPIVSDTGDGNVRVLVDSGLQPGRRFEPTRIVHLDSVLALPLFDQVRYPFDEDDDGGTHQVLTYFQDPLYDLVEDESGSRAKLWTPGVRRSLGGAILRNLTYADAGDRLTNDLFRSAEGYVHALRMFEAEGAAEFARKNRERLGSPASDSDMAEDAVDE